MEKKVLFLQLIGKTYGGVWQVNKTVGEELIKNGYQVSIVSLRENQNNIKIEHQKKLKLHTINKKDIWENTSTGTEIIKEIKKLHFIKAIKKIFKRLKHEISIVKDKKQLHKYIYDYKPNYIIATHYQLIDLIPKELLNITIYEHHTSFKNLLEHKSTKKTLHKYKDTIKYIWLTKTTMNNAIEYGFKNNYYIYNAVRFKSKQVSNVLDNKKLITIARFTEEKRIDLMIDIVKEVFKDKKYRDWTLEIYGTGPEEELIKNKINNHPQIKLMGLTTNPKKELMTASINLNTSSFEGFCLSILEATECGVPTITLDFGESVSEEIIDSETGIIAKDKIDYINKLKELMSKNEELLKLSKNAKEFSNNFQIENIIRKWIEIFNEMDDQNNEK